MGATGASGTAGVTGSDGTAGEIGASGTAGVAGSIGWGTSSEMDTRFAYPRARWPTRPRSG